MRRVESVILLPFLGIIYPALLWLLPCAINCDRISTGTVLDPGGHRQTANVTVLLRYGQRSSVNVTGTTATVSRERDRIENSRLQRHH